MGLSLVIFGTFVNQISNRLLRIQPMEKPKVG